MQRRKCLICAVRAIVLISVAGSAAQDVQRQNTARPVELPFERFLPGAVDQYEIMAMSSTWGREYVVHSRILDADGLQLQAARGRSSEGTKPWLLVRHIESGRGVGIFLAYPGNWRIEVEQAGENTVLRASTIPSPLEAYDNLKGLPVPGALVSEFRGNWDHGANAIKSFIRNRLLRDLGEDWPLVQYNTWFDQSEHLEPERLLKLAEVAADLGCELFVIDAGWYGNHPDWSKALGEWTVNRERLPDGIEPIARRVRELGMKFGLWVEIENADRDSPIVTENPNWILPVTTTFRDRVCLDFGNPAVLAWVSETIARLVRNYDLDYIKMDFNTSLLIDPETDRRDRVLWRHYRGLGRLWQDMRRKYPELVVENCSSGSLRSDLSIAAYNDTHWVSDAVGNWENLVINFGAAYIFPPEMNNHWTCTPADTDYLDVQACFRVNMLGQLGLSGSIIPSNSDAPFYWSYEVIQRARKEIALYKKLRPIIRNADVFHLTAQADISNPGTAQIMQFTDPNSARSLIFVFGGGQNKRFTIRPIGLNPETSYCLSGYDDYISEAVLSGERLMRGHSVELPKSNASAILIIKPLP